MPKLFIATCFAFVTLISCTNRKTLFKQLSQDQTGVDFNNTIVETDSVNILDFENVYNGGGVAAGDFNNDGLQDLYFTGNTVECKLYLNKGDLSFIDITKEAAVSGNGKWCRGVAAVDINNDGWLDIYVCATIKPKPEDRANLLYVNQGLNKNGVPVFKEMAREFGVADTAHSTMAAFFDYDNDGDLDLYIANNEIIDNDYPNRFRPIIKDGSHPSTDRLYRNDLKDSLNHPYFTNVSQEAGILWDGYSHGLNISDVNQDGWKDIYVSNDYLSGNLLYINNHDGTFANKVFDYFKHGAANAMGNDIIDINNDGLSDLVEVDMNPEDNFRKKMMMNANSYQTYQNIEDFGYHYQYVRNTLQVNQGNRINGNDSAGDPVFADLGYFSGIAETDWSWTPSVADFDNDGYRDIIISNGFPKDVTDHDFIAYRNEAHLLASKKQMLEQIPEVKLNNYAFRNNGDLTFTNVTGNWGLKTPAFSNGAIYVDLDNDGDLEYVANNINDKAFLFENTLNNKEETRNNFLKVKLRGDNRNIQGIGAWVEIYYNNDQRQVYENSPYRGYLSTVDGLIHFGLGNNTIIDSMVVKWPGNKKQVLKKVALNQTISVDIKNADEIYSWPRQSVLNGLFTDISRDAGINYKQEEKDFIDFNIQKLLPHKLSEYGPALAAGDMNGDGLDDLFVGGAKYHSGIFLIQEPDGSFIQNPLVTGKEETGKMQEDMGILLFDADSDNDLDLYCASGTYENLPNSPDHRDRFYVNDGKGNFRADTTVLPVNYTSKSCVKAGDYDRDGDLDLFIGGRVFPGSYPKPVSSFIYRNDSKQGQIRFTDVTATVAKELQNIGLVCDALWTDYDNDGWIDLLLAGEWMPLTFFKNNKGVFTNSTAGTGIQNEIGWWNSLAGGDFDNDGDIDYIAGNLGLNSFYKASKEYPVSIYAKDFDNNGSYDAIPSLFIPDIADGQKKEFPAHTRDDLVKQMIGIRGKFPGYKEFAQATIDQVLTKEELKDALVLKANYFGSSFIRNLGNGKFEIKALPLQAQWAPLNAMIADDLDDDGNLDIIVNGNDFGTEVSVGRYDAMNGLLLKGDGNGGFNALGITQSGIYIPGDGKALVKLIGANKRYMVAATQNRGPLKMFDHKNPGNPVALNPDDINILYQIKNGKSRKEELYYGTGFLSQSSRFIRLNNSIISAEVTNNKLQKRKLK